MDSTIRGANRESILAAAKAGDDLADHPEALDDRGWPPARMVRVIEYTVPDRGRQRHRRTDRAAVHDHRPRHARADELAVAYHQRWEQETGHDQLKTHLRGPGKILRSRLPELVHQEIWAHLIVHHAICALIAKGLHRRRSGPRPDLLAKTLRLIRRSATGTADIPPYGLGWRPPRNTWPTSPPCSSPNAPALGAVKRARHNQYRVKKPGEPASIRHTAPVTTKLHNLNPRAA